MTFIGLILLCRLKFRVWPYAHMGGLRPKMIFTSYQLPKTAHMTKFRQNPRFWGSACYYDLKNLSVNGYKVVILWKQFRMKMCTLHNKSLVCWLTFLSSLPILRIWSLIPKIKFISWIFCSGINFGIYFEKKYGLVSWYYWKNENSSRLLMMSSLI